MENASVGNVIFLGPPGVGKGTQAALLQQRFQFVHYSTGEMLRAISKKTTPLGAHVAEIMLCGALVSDDTICAIVAQTLEAHDAKNPYILDGFPRTVEQAVFLESFLQARGQKTELVVYFSVPESILFARILQRGLTGEQRPREDDSLEILEKRLLIFREKTLPLVSFYEERSVCYTVDATKAIEEVFADIANYLSRQREKS